MHANEIPPTCFAICCAAPLALGHPVKHLYTFVINSPNNESVARQLEVTNSELGRRYGVAHEAGSPARLQLGTACHRSGYLQEIPAPAAHFGSRHRAGDR